MILNFANVNGNEPFVGDGIGSTGSFVVDGPVVDGPVAWSFAALAGAPYRFHRSLYEPDDFAHCDPGRGAG